MAILSKALCSISVLCSGYTCVLSFSLFHFTQSIIADVFENVLIHAFSVPLSFHEMISSVYSLVSLFLMSINRDCEKPGFGDY